jgi:predicted DsbA family dithiol-disulfide isomerase
MASRLPTNACLDAASRLSAASSNGHRQPIFARTLLAAKKTQQIQVPPVDNRVFEEYLASKRNIGLAEREILTLVHIYYFEKPYVPRFPDSY